MIRKIAIEVMLTILITLFVYTGLSKLINYSVFREQIATSPLLAPIASAVAKSLPFIEFAIALLLLIPKWRKIGFLTSTLILVLFTFYIIAIMTLNKNEPCSCGGILEEISWKAHIVINLTLSILSFFCYKATSAKVNHATKM